jgi:hypothetical protein
MAMHSGNGHGPSALPFIVIVGSNPGACDWGNTLRANDTDPPCPHTATGHGDLHGEDMETGDVRRIHVHLCTEHTHKLHWYNDQHIPIEVCRRIEED